MKISEIIEWLKVQRTKGLTTEEIEKLFELITNPINIQDNENDKERYPKEKIF